MDRITELSQKAFYSLTDAERSEYDSLVRNGAEPPARADLASDSDVANAAGYGARANVQTDAENRAFNDYLRYGYTGPELRAAAGTTTGPTGGFNVPQNFWDNLQVALKQYGGLSEDFKQVNTDDGAPMPWPTINPTGVTASYLTENNQLTNQAYTFGQGMMFAWTIAELVLASLQLVQDSAASVDEWVAARIGEAVGRKIATEVVSGLGPSSFALVGIIPALNDFGAASTGTGGILSLGTATAVKDFAHPTSGGTELGDNVLSPQTCADMIEAVDPAYWQADGGCKWYMNAAQAYGMRSLVDGNGRPLINFDDGLADGGIMNLMGFPVKVVNDIPNLSASTAGGPIFGNLQHAMVLRTVQGAQLMRLTERYADYLQVGFIGYVRMDSQPNDLRAAVTVLPSST